MIHVEVDWQNDKETDGGTVYKQILIYAILKTGKGSKKCWPS